jgi:hypothetical protein
VVDEEKRTVSVVVFDVVVVVVERNLWFGITSCG